MGEQWPTVLRVVIGVGIAVFMWSVASSLEKIALALSRLADAALDRRARTEDTPKSPDHPDARDTIRERKR
jgi:hypothetical protein